MWWTWSLEPQSGPLLRGCTHRPPHTSDSFVYVTLLSLTPLLPALACLSLTVSDIIGLVSSSCSAWAWCEALCYILGCSKPVPSTCALYLDPLPGPPTWTQLRGTAPGPHRWDTAPDPGVVCTSSATLSISSISKKPILIISSAIGYSVVIPTAHLNTSPALETWWRRHCDMGSHVDPGLSCRYM